MSRVLNLFNGLSLIARLITVALVVCALTFAVHRFSGALHYLIFGNTEAKVERGNTVIAKGQTVAEGKIASEALNQVQGRDVYREHITEVVRQSEGVVNDKWHGETVGKDVDAAGADALCRLHDSLCRGPGPAAVQPLR